VRIEANTTEEYVVRLPVPVDITGRMPPYFVQDIEVLMGYPVFALGEYDYGTGLEVRASGYVEFEWTKTWPESWNEIYGNITMTTGAEGWDDPGRPVPGSSRIGPMQEYTSSIAASIVIWKLRCSHPGAGQCSISTFIRTGRAGSRLRSHMAGF
jgi:hypothetical protein